MSENNGGWDIGGLGKVAEAIPPSVYERSAETLLTTFQKITAPLTETTSGLGRYLQQKFDNMVAAEKAIAIYTVEKAMVRAQARAKTFGGSVHPPESAKNFVRVVEEAARETDPLLHEMWANLLASQLSDNACHPHFVQTLSHFSPDDARALMELRPLDSVGEHGGEFAWLGPEDFGVWMPMSGAACRPWSISCTLLLEFRFADLVAPTGEQRVPTAILYRTNLGSAFLAAVSEPPYDPATL